MDEPLVSICVISYNSRQTIQETLDSIVSQTYPHNKIEVIISDDASADGSQDVIAEWVERNQDKFYRVLGIYNQTNGGISKNCNSAWRIASGMWVKTIAADDILLPCCISENMKFVAENTNVQIVMSSMIVFSDYESSRHCLPSKKLTNSSLRFFDLSAEQQHVFLQSRDVAGAPSAFMSKLMLVNVGYADEKYRMMEDHPLWYKCTGLGIKIYFMDVDTVMYRVGNSITRSKSKLINIEYLKEVIAFDQCVLGYDSVGTFSRIRKMAWIKLLYILSLLCNKKNIITNFLYFIILMIKPGYITYKIEVLIRSFLRK